MRAYIASNNCVHIQLDEKWITKRVSHDSGEEFDSPPLSLLGYNIARF